MGTNYVKDKTDDLLVDYNNILMVKVKRFDNKHM